MTDLKIFPQGVRLLIKLNKVEQMTTKGGVILPDAHHEESRLGTIVAMGNDVDKIESSIFPKLWDIVVKFFTGKYRTRYKLGDQILIAFFSGTVLHFPGEGMSDDTIRMIVQSEIMAKVGDNGQ